MNTVKFASIGLAHPLNAQFKPMAEKVMKELDKMQGKDFDITDIEVQAGGPFTQEESARIAKIIMDCHERGGEWVDKWNNRTLKANKSMDATVMAGAVGASSKVN